MPSTLKFLVSEGTSYVKVWPGTELDKELFKHPSEFEEVELDEETLLWEKMSLRRYFQPTQPADHPITVIRRLKLSVDEKLLQYHDHEEYGPVFSIPSNLKEVVEELVKHEEEVFTIEMKIRYWRSLIHDLLYSERCTTKAPHPDQTQDKGTVQNDTFLTNKASDITNKIDDTRPDQGAGQGQAKPKYQVHRTPGNRNPPNPPSLFQRLFTGHMTTTHTLSLRSLIL